MNFFKPTLSTEYYVWFNAKNRLCQFGTILDFEKNKASSSFPESFQIICGPEKNKSNCKELVNQINLTRSL